MKFTVYIAINVVNGKRYIGVTGKGVDHRSQKHWEKARAGGNECPRFYTALRKYGPEAFAWKALFVSSDRAEAYRKEHELVRDLKPEYNSAAGGLGTPGVEPWNRRPVLCLEDGVVHASAMAAATFYGSNLSDICRALRGECRWVGRRHFCYADAAPISNAEAIAIIDRRFVQKRRRVVERKEMKTRRGIIGGRDVKGRSAAGPLTNARKVICLDDGKVFESLSDAARHYDVDTGALSQVCSGKRFRRTVGGKAFKYAEALH